ncbi:hypothetical protein E2C01_029520 [Portunus trituberculatus]|uniref:Uncharacterized protein n=1 Tax=Portunus trituberculatus TaxID=210409 RepID=A0A5B7ET56_PORTR|nr:hypothetical protein [Portunus trituberculatus]
MVSLTNQASSQPVIKKKWFPKCKDRYCTSVRNVTHTGQDPGSTAIPSSLPLAITRLKKDGQQQNGSCCDVRQGVEGQASRAKQVVAVRCADMAARQAGMKAGTASA